MDTFFVSVERVLDPSLEDRPVITGGDSGIGRAAAIAFAREGADVAINYLHAEEPDAREVVALIKQAGRKALAVPGDIRDERTCQHLVGRAARELGGLDILVNNAASSTPSNASRTSPPSSSTPRTRPTSTRCSGCRRRRWLTCRPEAQLLDYASTKAAIVAFTKALAKQVAQRGIRVNAVAPGPYWAALQVTGGQSPDKVVSFGQNTPLGRPGQPAEIAPVYVLLASAEATDVTGQVYGASGGRGEP